MFLNVICVYYYLYHDLGLRVKKVRTNLLKYDKKKERTEWFAMRFDIAKFSQQLLYLI